MANGQVDGLEADLEFSWNQRFDKVSKVILQMNAVFMPMAAVVSGRVWQSLPAADRELITKTVKSTLDSQIDELAGNEPKLVENFKNAPIPTPQVFDAMANGQVDGLEADLEFSWNQRFDKVAKVILQMNAVFMPMAAVVSGRVWQSLPAADRELITKTVKSTLDAQIDELAGNEPKLVENFKNAPIPIRQVDAKDTEAVVAEFDKIWLPKAPVLAELRKVGATL
jgi:TRAP-type C4-dicarboxylate transport system substrate-binding protein